MPVERMIKDAWMGRRWDDRAARAELAAKKIHTTASSRVGFSASRTSMLCRRLDIMSLATARSSVAADI